MVEEIIFESFIIPPRISLWNSTKNSATLKVPCRIINSLLVAYLPWIRLSKPFLGSPTNSEWHDYALLVVFGVQSCRLGWADCRSFTSGWSLAWSLPSQLQLIRSVSLGPAGEVSLKQIVHVSIMVIRLLSMCLWVKLLWILTHVSLCLLVLDSMNSSIWDHISCWVCPSVCNICECCPSMLPWLATRFLPVHCRPDHSVTKVRPGPKKKADRTAVKVQMIYHQKLPGWWGGWVWQSN